VPGGALMIAEKILATTARFQDALTFPDYDFKQEQGFSAAEILEKERQLRGQMTLGTAKEIVDLPWSVRLPRSRAGLAAFSVRRNDSFEVITTSESVMMARPKAFGTRGSWFAEVLGVELPCVSDHWLRQGRYLDPGAKPGDKRWQKYYRAIANGKVILTYTEPTTDGRLARKGYVGVYIVDNVRLSSDGLQFDLKDRELRLA
jgi:hypothetical protein